MGVNFPLVLLLATSITVFIWLFDIIYLRSHRQTSRREAKFQGGVTETLGKEIQEPKLIEYSKSFFPVLAIVLLLRSFLFEPFQIPTGSMIPTLQVGDFILVNKYSYGLRLPVFGTKIVDIGEPKNGDVMVFIPPHENEYFIKRVVGIPGDRIRYEDKTLFINDQKQTLDFVSQYPPINPQYLVYNEFLGDTEHGIHRNPYVDPRVLEWQVPPGNYFMMGDNRDQSSDSRYWGFVPEKNIVGKAIAVWLHKEPGLKFPEIKKNRWIE